MIGRRDRQQERGLRIRDAEPVAGTDEPDVHDGRQLARVQRLDRVAAQP
jgi:hypothetical protein